MANPQLTSIKRVTGRVVVKTGLRIGGNQETMEISGLDNPIIRNPANAEPFIPGSSLKGKMRSLAEWYFGEVPANGDVIHPDPRSRTAAVFGLPAKAPGSGPDARFYQRGPTRLVVRDALLSQESRRRFKEGRPVTEAKTENSINRLTSMANPRPVERVLPETTFDLDILYRVFDVDGDGGKQDEDLFSTVFLAAMALLQADALGGGGSRGNGKVEFRPLLVEDAAGKRDLELPALRFPAPLPAVG